MGKAVAIKPGQIRKIKTLARRVFGGDDDGYRLMLWNLAGVKSCKELKGAQVDLVIGHLERSAGQSPPPAGEGRGVPYPDRATGRQLQEIRRLWELVSVWPPPEREGALRRFLENRFGARAPEWLTKGQASNAIQGLKAMWRRGHP